MENGENEIGGNSFILWCISSLALPRWSGGLMRFMQNLAVDHLCTRPVLKANWSKMSAHCLSQYWLVYVRKLAVTWGKQWFCLVP